jgi:hypothetical protein
LLSVAGSALKLRTELKLDPRTTVKVEEGNRMWLGEVCACEPEAYGFSVEIEAGVMLRNVAETKHMASQFRRAGKPEPPRETNERVGPRREMPR